MNLPRWYRLEARTPVPCDWFESARWRDENPNDARVGLTDVGGVVVSNFGTTPILFETMVQRDGEWGEQQRYATWEEAEKGHSDTVERVRMERSG